MRNERTDPAYLLDMLNAANDVIEFIKDLDVSGYLADKKAQAAVERKIEILGEAARNISDNFKTGHPEIPWRAVIAQRNVIAHDYGDIRHEKLWIVASVKIPELINELKKVVQI